MKAGAWLSAAAVAVVTLFMILIVGVVGFGGAAVAAVAAAGGPCGTAPGTGAGGPLPATGGRAQYADGYLAGVGAPLTQQNRLFLAEWMIAESGPDRGDPYLSPAHYNPLNSARKAPGSTDFNVNNGHPVQNYPSFTVGLTTVIAATVTTGFYDSNLLPALRDGSSAMRDAFALAASPWGTGPMVIRLLGGGHPPAGPPPHGSPAPDAGSCTGGSVPPPSNAAAIAIAYARKQLGKPYQFDAAGPYAFDCSGLTMMAYHEAGIALPHFAASQYPMGPHPTRAQLLPGDLIFYATNLTDYHTIHHVGIYIGNGQMIDAPHTNAVVHIVGIDSPGYYGATRIAPATAGGPTPSPPP